MKLLIAANDNQPRRSVLPPSLPPRGLCREVAAEYFGISPSSFDIGVKDGTIPPPRKFRGRVLWDRIELDRAFDDDFDPALHLFQKVAIESDSVGG